MSVTERAGWRSELRSLMAQVQDDNMENRKPRATRGSLSGGCAEKSRDLTVLDIVVEGGAPYEI